jgi:hypothetical protein
VICVFHKSDIEHLWNCIEEREPLSPPDGQWNGSRALIAAAVLLFNVLYRSVEQAAPGPAQERTLEADEMRSTIARRNLSAVLRLLSSVVGEIAGGTYDRLYGPVLRIDVQPHGDQSVVIKPLNGFKKVEDGHVLVYEI